MVKYSRKIRRSWSVAYSEFMNSYRKEENSVYFFCEGNDDKKYYSSAIEKNSQYGRDNIKSYSCGGKDEVIKLEKQIVSIKAYSNEKVLFFVDRDFDDNTNISTNIYVTNYYSIENYYTSINTFKEILKYEYDIGENTEDFNNAVSSFNVTKERFHNEITLLNAFLACQADYRNQTQQTTRLDIEKSLNRHFSGADCFDKVVNSDFSINFNQDLTSIHKVRQIFCKAPNIEDNEINDKVTSFNQQNKSEVFRGKFEIKFFISFLKRLKEQIGCKIDINKDNFSTILLGYVYTPNCLKNYIKRKI